MDTTYIFYNARNVCVQMLIDRGYSVPAQIINVPYSEFLVYYKNNKIDLFGISDNTEGKNTPVYVLFVTPNVNSLNISSFTGLLKIPAKNFSMEAPVYLNEVENGNMRLIIIYSPDVAGSTKSAGIKFPQNTHFLETFNVNFLSIDPIHHVLQPTFILIRDTNEKKRIMSNYNVSASQFPSMCIDDPVNKYYNGRAGDLFLIIRNESQKSYRLVTQKEMSIKQKKKDK